MMSDIKLVKQLRPVKYKWLSEDGINVDKLVKCWNHLYIIIEFDTEFLGGGIYLYKHFRKNKMNQWDKFVINKNDFEHLRDHLDLGSIQSNLQKTWIKKEYCERYFGISWEDMERSSGYIEIK